MEKLDNIEKRVQKLETDQAKMVSKSDIEKIEEPPVE